MQKIIAIQANSVDSINFETDTTLQLALEAQKRSYQIYWYETKDLSLIKGKVYAKAKKVVFFCFYCLLFNFFSFFDDFF